VRGCAPRIVVFETSGSIALNYPIFVTCPYVTIAGQSAPSPGITVTNRAVFFDTHDVVIQHLRFRMGDVANQAEEDTIYIRNGAYNIVLDHVSLSWGTHENLGINAFQGSQPTAIAVLDCIIAEGLAKPLNPAGIGQLLYASVQGSTATMARNLYAHNGNRNPWISPGWRVSGINNVAYNAAGVAGDAGTYGFSQFQGTGYPVITPFDIVWVGNVAVPGPDTHHDVHPVKIALDERQTAAGFRVFLSNNAGPFMTASDQWGGVTFQDAATESTVRANAPPDWHTAFQFVPLPPAVVVSYVTAHAGARPKDRDAVDRRIALDVVAQGGHIISSQALVGGYPELPVIRQPYTAPARPNDVAQGQTFRTNVEVDLETKARALE
jgi:hypothetical protein